MFTQRTSNSPNPSGNTNSLVPLCSHKTRLLWRLVRYFTWANLSASANTSNWWIFWFFFFWESSDILAFFQGSPDGSIPGRDDLAKEIAGHAYKFVQERWREEDMRSFMYLLILEVSRFFFPTSTRIWSSRQESDLNLLGLLILQYWRLMSDDRKAASYQGWFRGFFL